MYLLYTVVCDISLMSRGRISQSASRPVGQSALGSALAQVIDRGGCGRLDKRMDGLDQWFVYHEPRKQATAGARVDLQD